MFDYAGLAALAAVVREGSFERAAQSLHVTPSAVSQRVRALEERMGCALVIRAHPCVATEQGRRLCQHVDRVRLLEHELQESLPTLSPAGPARAVLRVAVNADSLATWFTPVIATYGAEAPVLLDLAVDDQDHTADWLRQGDVLAAVTGTARPAAGCNSQPLGAMRYVAAASPAYVARYFSAGVSALSLSQAPSLVFSAKDDLQARWVRRLCACDVDLPRHTLPSAHAFVEAALAGMGWGVHPLSLVEGHLREGRLVQLVDDSPLDVPLFWQVARSTASLVAELSSRVTAAAARNLLQSR